MESDLLAAVAGNFYVFHVLFFIFSGKCLPLILPHAHQP